MMIYQRKTILVITTQLQELLKSCYHIHCNMGLQSSIKKIELPIFNGDRREWPEFKAPLKHLAEAAIPSQQALAFELKRHTDSGHILYKRGSLQQNVAKI